MTLDVDYHAIQAYAQDSIGLHIARRLELQDFRFWSLKAVSMASLVF